MTSQHQHGVPFGGQKDRDQAWRISSDGQASSFDALSCDVWRQYARHQRSSEETSEPWLSSDTIPQEAIGFVAPSPEELAYRLIQLDEFFAEGLLYDEVARLGIKPEWLGQLHKEPMRVVISEQQQPLTSLFSAIDEYGAPRELGKCLRDMGRVVEALERLQSEKVDSGFLVSRYHGVSFQGISFGGYVTLPDDEAPRRINFFSKREREQFANAAYGDLRVSAKQMNTIWECLEKGIEEKRRESSKYLATVQKQQSYNEALRARGEEPSEEQVARVWIARHEQVAAEREVRMMQNLKGDLQYAFGTVGLLDRSMESVSYLHFVAAFNAKLAHRVEPRWDFGTFFNDTIDHLPSTGVADWPTFVKAITDVGLISKEDCLVRLRTASSSGKIVYVNGYIRELSDAKVTLFFPPYCGTKEYVCDLQELSERSSEMISQGQAPLIVPCAELRYLFNLGYSRSVIFYDGMPYERIRRAIDALKTESFVLAPREATLHAYSRLWQHSPSNPSAPWGDLRERFASHEYYGAP
jgi:hypothetical protein